ncbi:helix-turn-helix domain-containing protein [Zhouia sp. PK063]|uniref:helix-turn-helix domain-containing protein n=1 Tax=Zhouia sp. PK063 TaxID=3373602 RepID=UPI0037B31BFF
MQEKYSLNASVILNKVKKSLQMKTDSELAELLDVRSNTLSTWKKRNTVDFIKVLTLCDKFNLDIKYIFREGTEDDDYFNETPLVSLNEAHNYIKKCSQLEYIHQLPKYKFPEIKGNTMAFETGNNTHESILKNAIIIGETSSFEQIHSDHLYIIVSDKILFGKCKLTQNKDTYNPQLEFYPTGYDTEDRIIIDSSKILQLWKIVGQLKIDDKDVIAKQFGEKLSSIEQRIKEIESKLSQRRLL